MESEESVRKAFLDGPNTLISGKASEFPDNLTCMSPQQQIELFFRDPNDVPGDTGLHSTLYLLRRDIRKCLSIGFADQNESIARWPGAIAILAGIDLLAKFFTGQDDFFQGPQKLNVSKRFTNFIENYFHLDSSDQIDAIYQLRNALIHSFGLYSQDQKTKKVYKFVLVWAKCNELATDCQDRGYYQVNLKILYDDSPEKSRTLTAIQG